MQLPDVVLNQMIMLNYINGQLKNNTTTPVGNPCVNEDYWYGRIAPRNEIIESIEPDNLFEILFKIGVTDSTENVELTDIQISCHPFIMISSPTVSPFGMFRLYIVSSVSLLYISNFILHFLKDVPASTIATNTWDPEIDHGVNIVITFEYTSTNKTVPEMEQYLRNITKTIITKQTETNDICIEADEYNTTIYPQFTNATITAKIIVCDKTNQDILTTSTEQNLQREFIENINNKDHGVLVIIEDNVDLEVDAINIPVSMISSTDIQHENKNVKQIEKLNNTTIIVIFVAGALTFICFCLFLGYLYYLKTKSDNDEDIQTLELGVYSSSGQFSPTPPPGVLQPRFRGTWS